MKMLVRHILLTSICVESVFLACTATADNDLARIDDRQWDRAAAAHLLRRAGFGGTPAEVDHLAALSLDDAVASLLDFARQPYDLPPPKLDPIVMQDPDFSKAAGATPQERQLAVLRRQEAERAAHQEIRLWWLERMARSPRSLEEKLTLFWHGHFTSGAREVKRASFMLEQNELLRRYAMGNFRDLVLAISKDRAMLVYLDNARNNKQTPNENYARELLELFTLGEGNYSEADIKAAARAFTGWTYNEDGFRFNAQLHDAGPKKFLGRTGNWNGDDIINIITQQQACGDFIAGELLAHFCMPDPPRKLANRLGNVLRNSNYELRPALETLFKSRVFYAPENRGALIRSPVEVVVGTARQLGIELYGLGRAERALAGLGQELMQPPNVKGWPGGSKWINTATLFERYNIAGALINGVGRFRPAEMLQAADRRARYRSEMEPVQRRGTQTQPPFDPLPELTARKLTTAPQVVQFYHDHLLAVPLTTEQRMALVEYLEEDGPFDGLARGAVDKVRTVIHLLCSTPEYQLY